MRFFFFFKLIVFSTLAAAIISCTGQKSEKKNTELLRDSISSDEILLENDDLEVLLPSPSEVLEVVLTSGIKYSENLSAPVGIEKKTVLIRNKAIIMGVYLADFSYYNIYSQRKLVTDYFSAIQTLAQDLGISSILNDAYFKRFDTNINNLDSIDKIFDEFSLYAYGTLIESGNSEMLSMIAMGSAIELLYMGLLSNDDVSNDIITSKILSQKDLFENYYQNFIKYNQHKDEFKKLIVDLDKLYNLYKSVLVEENHSVVVTDGDSHFTIKNVSKAKLSSVDVDKIKDEVIEIRQNMIDLKY